MASACSSFGPSSQQASSSDAGPAQEPDGSAEASTPPPCPGPALPAPQGTVRFISPSGDDVNPGTREKPVKTFAGILPKLGPGDALVLLDGEYKRETTGLLKIVCGNEIRSGTPEARIFLRADNERRAWIHSDGA